MTSVPHNKLRLVEKMAQAIFSREGATVAEAYSTFDKPLRYFKSADEVVEYGRAKISSASDTFFIGVVYPDMLGECRVRRITLSPKHVRDHTHRFVFEGWGVVWIQLHLNSYSSLGSEVSSNSEKRALVWSTTIPELPPPSTWQWKAVESHTRRLKRALAKATELASHM